MKLSSVVKAALGSLCLLVVDGFPVPNDGSPKIIGQRCVQVHAHPGEQRLLHCKAFANGNTDMTLIYWLVDGVFPEDMPSSGRIVESKESTSKDGKILHRSLLLKNITSDDIQSTFTCVVMNGAGMDQKHVTISPRHIGCNVGKDRKHCNCKQRPL